MCHLVKGHGIKNQKSQKADFLIVIIWDKLIGVSKQFSVNSTSGSWWIVITDMSAKAIHTCCVKWNIKMRCFRECMRKVKIVNSVKQFVNKTEKTPVLTNWRPDSQVRDHSVIRIWNKWWDTLTGVDLTSDDLYLWSSNLTTRILSKANKKACVSQS